MRRLMHSYSRPHLKLTLCLSELCLVGVVRLHGRVKLVQHLEYFLVDLVTDLTALYSKMKASSVIPCNWRLKAGPPD